MILVATENLRKVSMHKECIWESISVLISCWTISEYSECCFCWIRVLLDLTQPWPGTNSLIQHMRFREEVHKSRRKILPIAESLYKRKSHSEPHSRRLNPCLSSLNLGVQNFAALCNKLAMEKVSLLGFFVKALIGSSPHGQRSHMITYIDVIRNGCLRLRSNWRR